MMTKVVCTAVKCKYNDYGKLGVCNREYIQIGGMVDPKDNERKTKPVCIEY